MKDDAVKEVAEFSKSSKENEKTTLEGSPREPSASVKEDSLRKPASSSISSPLTPPGLQAPEQSPAHHNFKMTSPSLSDQSNANLSKGINAGAVPPRPPPGMGPLPSQSSVTSNTSLPGPPPGMPPPMRPTRSEGPTSTPRKISSSSILPARTQVPASDSKDTKTSPATTPSKPVKVRRTQTRCEDQPGRLFANNMPAAAFNSASNKGPTSLVTTCRSELTARWVLPLPYLRNRALRRFKEQKSSSGASPQNLTIRDALRNLAVGLFRRGAMENGLQSSIVSKEILASDGGEHSKHPSGDYFFNIDQRSDAVFGTVPFYAPRTPGNVVFRLYFEDKPHVTLATGPCIKVVPSDREVDSVLRFILSNFKAKKTNGISSMTSLASVFELFSPQENAGHYAGACRVAWGCLCEARKVVEKAGLSYLHKRRELDVTEKIKDLLPDVKTLDDEAEPRADNEEGKNNDTAPTDATSKERAFNERKWREIQLVYASVLKAALSNEANHFLLKKDVVSRMRPEYDLWCPMIEAFAPNPFALGNQEEAKLPGGVSAYPHIFSKEDIRKCQESRKKLQHEVLGFAPQCIPPLALQAKSYKWKKTGRNFYKELSSAMNELYRDEYAVSDKVWKRREKVRATIEHVVSRSGEFPQGTKVAVFGSSANGFGYVLCKVLAYDFGNTARPRNLSRCHFLCSSPNSDLDLCLQVPPSATNFTKENGVEAMTNLATRFTEAGMTDVDTVRLTARIPILKFNVPFHGDDDEILVECDLSLQNPLACLNTSLLHAYAKISPTTRILASIIKRWAKNREINNPSQHTLSSYGYVIMLLSFLTASDFTKDGFIAVPGNDCNPILPNLMWVDPLWAQNPEGHYREIAARPKNQQSMVQHPTEANYYVNSYFYKTGLEGLTKFCSTNHNSDTALGALLASFFHFFAYEFDYKKHIVSLTKKHSSPPVEREVKAEEDGWSLFRHGLAIEDPFELFYDVAHVLKASNFQHIRKEFSLAYTHIYGAAYTNKELLTGRQLIDLICQPVTSNE
ncbi:hypothetical protein ACHAWF_006242 [Thalassiosira exigua]